MKYPRTLTLTFWKSVAIVFILLGVIAAVERYSMGLGATTHLVDTFPWGIWIGFDILVGVGLAAGGFTIAATVYLFNIERFRPILRPTVLTAFLGYILVIAGLMVDLGRPWAIWHAIIMWNPHSVMFEVAWCVMLYTSVLALEFSPVVLEKFHMTKTTKLVKKVTIPMIIIGVLLSTLHQSSLGSLYLIVPDKLFGLWYSPYLPVFFYVSAIAVGCAMIIFESFMSSRAFHRGLELNLLTDIARIAVMVLGVFMVMTVVDLADRKAMPLLFQARTETYFFWLEKMVGVIIPFILLAQKRVRENQNGLFWSAAMIIIGFVLNRLNISITGMEGWAGLSYFPSWMEISVTLSIVAVGFIIFGLAAKYLPLFKHEQQERPRMPEAEWIEDLRSVSQPN